MNLGLIKILFDSIATKTTYKNCLLELKTKMDEIDILHNIKKQLKQLSAMEISNECLL